MSIYSYIATNINDINQFPQGAKNWRTMYNGRGIKEVDAASANYPWFQRAMKEMPDNLSRKMVAGFYAQDLYRGFIATLLWGGAHCNHINHFRCIVYYPDTTILPYLINVYNSLRNNGMTAELFSSFCRGGVNHIHGLGPSYFTKVFYFMALFLGYNDILILDTKLWKVYNDFLVENNRPQKTYSLSSCTPNDYLEYLYYMNHVQGVTHSDQLEAFLFEKYKHQK